MFLEQQLRETVAQHAELPFKARLELIKDMTIPFQHDDPPEITLAILREVIALAEPGRTVPDDAPKALKYMAHTFRSAAGRTVGQLPIQLLLARNKPEHEADAATFAMQLGEYCLLLAEARTGLPRGYRYHVLQLMRLAAEATQEAEARTFPEDVPVWPVTLGDLGVQHAPSPTNNHFGMHALRLLEDVLKYHKRFSSKRDDGYDYNRWRRLIGLAVNAGESARALPWGALDAGDQMVGPFLRERLL